MFFFFFFFFFFFLTVSILNGYVSVTLLTEKKSLCTYTLDTITYCYLAARTVAYFGCNGEEYIEAYPAVQIS